MTAIEAQLIERLNKLPPSRVAEVVGVVEFASQREEGAAIAQRLTQGLARLDALNLPYVQEDEIEAEIQAARQQRRRLACGLRPPARGCRARAAARPAR
jgi:hypothetical protein